MKAIRDKVSRLKRFLRNEDGVAAIEFAIVSVLFLFVLFAIVEATRAVWAQNTLKYAIEEAARERIIDDTMTEADVENFVLGRMTGLINTATVDITISTTTTASGVEVMNITGTIDYTMMLPLLPDTINTFPLSAETHMPI